MVYDVPPAFAKPWIDSNIAKPSADIPHDIRPLFDRLDIGRNQTALFLPFIGEFGHEVMTHLRIVHFNKAEYKIVCCRPGNEALYPSADEFVTDWQDPVNDLERVGTMERYRADWYDLEARYPHAEVVPAGNLDQEQAAAAINPAQPIPFRPRRRGLQADVLIGTRHRGFCPEKNWQHYPQLAEALRRHGYTYAVIGRKPGSHDLEGQTLHTGDMDTDAAIELLQSPALYIGTDSGTTHLAATCRTEMIVFGLHTRQHRNYIPRMQQVNDRITYLPNVWDKPEEVIETVLARLNKA
jgi:hypothetical protein